MRLHLVFEETKTGWSAYVPELPGLGVAGATKAETRNLLLKGIELHLEDLRSTAASKQRK